MLDEEIDGIVASTAPFLDQEDEDTPVL